ncbi:MAG: M23 family metallopeptidase [Actinobacteria bacterium]|nr:M23 family metallopeptidase [Actinomycetota bacterium]
MGGFETWTAGRPDAAPPKRWRVTVAAVLVGAGLAVAGRVAAPGLWPQVTEWVGQPLGGDGAVTGGDRRDDDDRRSLQRPASVCPVVGTVSFVDDFGVRKPDGRRHRGIDLYAYRGTPVAASVPGRVEHVEGDRGGLQYVLHGDDGVRYVGAHLERRGEHGRVAAATVVGYVGTSGNAVGSRPHLHFEMLTPEGPINPFSWLDEHCR